MSKFIKALSYLLNPMTYIKWQRMLLLRHFCIMGYGTKLTHRSEIFHHGKSKHQIYFGDYSILDGTLEVYDKGKLKIGAHCYIGRARIYCTNNISIGDFCLISDNVCIMDSNLHPISASKRRLVAESWSNGIFPDVYSETPNDPIVIENHCWIGFGSAILKGVCIGEGSIVGANSVVTKNIPPWTIVAGNPAQIIREIPEHER